MTRTAHTACILCSLNCGLELTLEGERIAKVRGDRAHPVSRGYLCQKAARLDYYQNHADRLDAPLRRRPDGSFQRISWEVALREIAERLVGIRERHGGRAFAFYGGGGQGNHLGGIYGVSLLRAMRSQYLYTALSQEKTGDFWVNGELFGRQTCHLTEGVEEAELVLFIGTNPWQAHGFPRARKVLQALAKAPDRTMVVIDPRRSETAAMADVHLQLRPGTDAFLLAALLALACEEGGLDREFLAARCVGAEEVEAALRAVPVEEFAARADVPLAELRRVARLLVNARSAAVRVDLGIQQSLHSTLNSYLEKLLFLLTGHFGRPGTNTFHSALVPLIGHSEVPSPRNGLWHTVVTGVAPIAKLYPPNVLPAEIDSDHPERVRALWVDSTNPFATGADSAAYRRAAEKLELLVVVDVALSESARLADYVLPASSQYEKWEATFFNLEFPENVFHLRRPVLPPRAGTLPEPEIYRKLLVAMGELPARFPLLERLARLDRRRPRLGLFGAALQAKLRLQPELAPYASLILYQTLGRALPDGAAAAAPLWASCFVYARKHAAAMRRAGYRGKERALAEQLFAQIITGEPTVMSRHEHDETWGFLRHADRRIHLAIPSLLAELRTLAETPTAADPSRPGAERPLMLVAGQRRSYNANTIYRDPRWRKSDAAGALTMHPADASARGLEAGDWSEVVSERGVLRVRIALDEGLRPGVVALPHGYGLVAPQDAAGTPTGPQVNEITDAAWRDPKTGVPYHKNVPVEVRALAVSEDIAEIGTAVAVSV